MPPSTPRLQPHNHLPYRSYFYVPPADAARVDAAYASSADAVVLDLEDLTPAEDKEAARAEVYRRARMSNALPTLVRINTDTVEASEADLDAAVGKGVTALRLPKSEDASRVRHIAARIERLRVRRGILDTIGLQVMVETSRGIENLPSLARATHTVWSLGIGEGDLRAELGTSADEGLAFARSSVVVAARSAGLPAPVQVAFPPHGTLDDLQKSTSLGRRLGFGARSLLNPDHVDPVHAIYQHGTAGGPA